MHAYIHTYILHAYIHTHILTCMRAYKCAYVCMRVCLYIHMDFKQRHKSMTACAVQLHVYTFMSCLQFMSMRVCIQSSICECAVAHAFVPVCLCDRDGNRERERVCVHVCTSVPTVVCLCCHMFRFAVDFRDCLNSFCWLPVVCIG